MSNARFRTLHVVDTLNLTDAVTTGSGWVSVALT